MYRGGLIARITMENTASVSYPPPPISEPLTIAIAVLTAAAFTWALGHREP